LGQQLIKQLLVRIGVLRHIMLSHNTIHCLLELGLGYVEAQLIGEAADHHGGRRAQLLEIDPHRRHAG
jgi:hypothetical protein